MLTVILIVGFLIFRSNWILSIFGIQVDIHGTSKLELTILMQKYSKILKMSLKVVMWFYNLESKIIKCCFQVLSTESEVDNHVFFGFVEIT